MVIVLSSDHVITEALIDALAILSIEHVVVSSTEELYRVSAHLNPIYVIFYDLDWELALEEFGFSDSFFFLRSSKTRRTRLNNAFDYVYSSGRLNESFYLSKAIKSWLTYDCNVIA